MNITSLIIQLISGAAGGNAAGAMLKQFSLGPVGNSILGLIGGGVGGQLLGIVPNIILIPLLVVILLASAVKVWRHG